MSESMDWKAFFNPKLVFRYPVRSLANHPPTACPIRLMDSATKPAPTKFRLHRRNLPIRRVLYHLPEELRPLKQTMPQYMNQIEQKIWSQKRNS